MQVPLYVPGGEEAEAPPAPEPAPPGDGRCTASPADGPRTAARAPTGRLTPGGRHGGALMTPGDGETGLLIAFSPPRDALALLAADGRLRTFDTGTGRLAVNVQSSLSSLPNGDSTVSNRAGDRSTCLVWAAGARKAGKGPGRIIVGTASGAVRAFSAAAGETLWTAAHAHEGSVASVAVLRGGGKAGRISSCGADCCVTVLDAANGDVLARFRAGKHALSCVAATPGGGAILAASSSIALWSLTDAKRLAKFTGHAAPVATLAFSPDGGYAASAAEGERQIALWPTHAAALRKKAQPAMAVISLNGPATALAVGPSPKGAAGGGLEGAGPFRVAAISRSGPAGVWDCAPGADGSLAVERCASMTVADSGEAGPSGRAEIIAADFSMVDNGSTVLVAFGSSVRPQFERITLPAPGQPAISTTLHVHMEGVLVPEKGVSPQANGQKQYVGSTQAISVAGPDTNPRAMLKTQVAQNALVASVRRKRPAEDVEVEEGTKREAEGLESSSLRPGMQDGFENADLRGDAQGSRDLEPTLGQRLEALQLQSAPAAMELETEGGDDGHIDASSLATVLTQALRSEDRGLLERCLASSNEAVAVATVRGLAPVDAVLLLQAAADRLRARPARGAQLAPWLRAVLQHHTAYLMAAPGAQAALTVLYQTIEARTVLYRPLCALAGRLDLLCAHMPGASGAAPSLGRDDLGRPEAIYTDIDENHVVPEDPFAPPLANGQLSDDEGEAGSQDSWETDDGASDEDSPSDED